MQSATVAALGGDLESTSEQDTLVRYASYRPMDVLFRITYDIRSQVLQSSLELYSVVFIFMFFRIFFENGKILALIHQILAFPFMQY